MANPKGKTGASYPEDRNEFIEIYNNSSDTVDLSRFTLSDFDVEDEICPWEDSSLLELLTDVLIGTTLLAPNSYALIMDREYGSDTTGGDKTPYTVPPSTLILTTDDTSIGNGLTMNDSIIIYNQSDTASFFFPSRTDDGYSMEMIDYEMGDIENNWYQSFNEGGTPGTTNSTSSFIDIKFTFFNVTPSFGRLEDTIHVKAGVKNAGFKKLTSWDYQFYIDDSLYFSYTGNTLIRGEESIINFNIAPLKPGTHTFLSVLKPEDDSMYNNRWETQYRVYPSGRCIGAQWYENTLKITFNFPCEKGDVEIRILNCDGITLLRKDFHETEGEFQIEEEFLNKKLIPGRYILIGKCRDIKSSTIFYIYP